MDGILNTEFIIENSLKVVSNQVEFVDALFLVYKKEKGGHQNTPSLIFNEDLMKWYNGKAIDMSMGDTCYPNFVPFTMD